MKRNMGTLDRVLRIAAAVGVGILYFTGAIEGTAALVLGGLALAFAATSLIGVCPAYVPFGINTCERTQA